MIFIIHQYHIFHSRSNLAELEQLFPDLGSFAKTDSGYIINSQYHHQHRRCHHYHHDYRRRHFHQRHHLSKLLLAKIDLVINSCQYQLIITSSLMSLFGL